MPAPQARPLQVGKGEDAGGLRQDPERTEARKCRHPAGQQGNARRCHSGSRVAMNATVNDVHLHDEHLGVAVPFQFRTSAGVLGLFSTTTIFGTPVDVTLQETALETFFPADAQTVEILRTLAAAP